MKIKRKEKKNEINKILTLPLTIQSINQSIILSPNLSKNYIHPLAQPVCSWCASMITQSKIKSNQIKNLFLLVLAKKYKSP